MKLLNYLVLLLLIQSFSACSLLSKAKPVQEIAVVQEQKSKEKKSKKNLKPGRLGPQGGMSSITDGYIYPDFPFVYHPEVNNFVRYYTKVKRDFVQEALVRRKKYMPIFKEVFNKYKLPIDLINIAFVESRFKPEARSKDGYTIGMWQLSTLTAKNYGLIVNKDIDERKDVRKSTEAAARFLAALYDTFGDWYLAAAAYNSGPRRVTQAIDIMNEEIPMDTLDVFELTSRGLVCDITREFVAKIGALVIITRDLKKYGFVES